MKTFEEIKKDPIGTIYVDVEKDNVRFIIIRNFGSLCAYVGVKKEHVLLDIKKIYEVEQKLWGGKYEFDLRCHGGITYEGINQHSKLPKDYFFLGWDYAHAGDCFLFEDAPFPRIGTKWTVEMVKKDSKDAIKAFKKIVKKASEGKLIRSITFNEDE